jgi:hypothetical protein
MSYQVAATFVKDGQILSCSTPEVLGNAYGKEFATEREAWTYAEELRASVEEFGLDSSTLYHVVPC